MMAEMDTVSIANPKCSSQNHPSDRIPIHFIMGRSVLTFRDSRLRGNDGGGVLSVDA